MIRSKVIPDKLTRGLKIDLSPELNAAADIVKLDIQAHIKDARRVDTEAALKPLAPATVEHKSKFKAGWQYDGKPATATEAAKIRSHANDPLQATENLLRNQKITKATRGNQLSTIEIGPTREKIYFAYLDDKRPVFGISEKASDKIDKFVELRIDRYLREQFK